MYEWNEAKRQANLRKHGVDFTEVEGFLWDDAVVFEDRRERYLEQRWVAFGPIGNKIHVLVFSEPEDGVTRVISLRHATRRETSCMRKKSGRRTTDPDNPEWTAADLRRARPSHEVVPHIVDAYLARKGRPPVGEESKVQVTLRLDPAVIAHFKARGPGWQTRINEALMKVVSAKGPAKKK